MAISGVAGAATGAYASSQAPVQSTGQHKHGHRHAASISDVDAQSSSVANTTNMTGLLGGKVNVTA
jgi:hypothetical protein